MAPDDLDDEAGIDPLDAILRGEPSPVPLAPNGGFNPQLPLLPERIPDATLENFVCLRGPCQYYMEMRMPAALGNTRGTFEKIPTQVNRFCHRMGGTYITLTDELVSACSEWDPRSGPVQEGIEERRAAYNAAGKVQS